MNEGGVSVRLATLARAKLNLTLAVLGRREDGFHALASIFLRLALADELAVETVPDGAPTSDPAADRLVVHDAPDCPVEGNLVLRAASLLRAHAVRPLPPLTWTLRKRIPVAAGLGGGSADAAAALELAATAWGQGLTRGERLAIAAELGSDVPFFALDVPAAHVGGRGEHVAPLPGPVPPPGVVLVVPDSRLATGDVFAAHAALTGAASARSHASGRATRGQAMTERLGELIGGGLQGAGLEALAAELRDANDLWPAALAVRPELAELRTAAETHLGRPTLLSGSGPALAALYPSADAAVAAAERLGRAAAALPPGTRVLATSAS